MKKLIEGLLTYINEQTDQHFDRIGDAVKFLVEHYKQHKSN